MLARSSAVPSAVDQLNHLTQLCTGYLGVHVLHIGLRLEVFAALDWAGRWVKAAELAQWLNLNTAWVEHWCRAADSFGFLQTSGDGYRLSPHMVTLLLKEEHALYFGGVPTALVQSVQESIAQWPDLFRSGTPPPASSDALIEAQAEFGRPGYQKLTEVILPRLPSLWTRLRQGAQVLEVGCGYGYGLARICADFQRVQAVGIDSHGRSVDRARQMIGEKGLQDRVRVEHRRAQEMDYQDCFDMVLMKQTLRSLGDGERMTVLDRCRQALTSDGWLLLVDGTYPARQETAHGMLDQFTTGFQLLELTAGGRVLTEGEVRSLVVEAGFNTVQRLPVGSPRLLVLAARR